jgi:hypothetical protein
MLVDEGEQPRQLVARIGVRALTQLSENSEAGGDVSAAARQLKIGQAAATRPRFGRGWARDSRLRQDQGLKSCRIRV